GGRKERPERTQPTTDLLRHRPDHRYLVTVRELTRVPLCPRRGSVDSPEDPPGRRLLSIFFENDRPVGTLQRDDHLVEKGEVVVQIESGYLWREKQKFCRKVPYVLLQPVGVRR